MECMLHDILHATYPWWKIWKIWTGIRKKMTVAYNATTIMLTSVICPSVYSSLLQCIAHRIP